jgi:hypothetical protein
MMVSFIGGGSRIKPQTCSFNNIDHKITLIERNTNCIFCWCLQHVVQDMLYECMLFIVVQHADLWHIYLHNACIHSLIIIVYDKLVLYVYSETCLIWIPVTVKPV